MNNNRVVIKDYTKPNYVIMIDTPQGESIIMSGTFTNLENAKKELNNRVEYHDTHVNLYNGYSNFYLVEIVTNIKKMED